MHHTVTSSRPSTAHSPPLGAESSLGAEAIAMISSPSSSRTPPSLPVYLLLAFLSGERNVGALGAGEGDDGRAEVETESRVVGSGDGMYTAASLASSSARCRRE